MNKKYDTTIKEAMEILGLSDTSIRRLIDSGQFSKRYDKGKRGKRIMLSSDEITALKEKRDKVSKKLPKKEETAEIKGAYDELRREHSELRQQFSELQQRHEVVVYRLGASENRVKELEAEAESLRAKKGIWKRIKDWWRGER